METKDLNSWGEFEKEIAGLADKNNEYHETPLGGFSGFLFRGQSNSKWKLETTLERASENPWSFDRYYDFIWKTKSEIETFTGKDWRLGGFPELVDWLKGKDNRYANPLYAYEYLVYLRHHGFPSPLMDWTRSPYIAAFFAFEGINIHGEDIGTSRVAIYVFQEHPKGFKLTEPAKPHIVGMGPNIKSHQRHYLQQSEYTFCARKESVSRKEEKFWFASHEDVFQKTREEQDLLWKFTVPAKEKVKVLKSFDTYNLNAYSLFQTEESLLNTIAIRELEFKEQEIY